MSLGGFVLGIINIAIVIAIFILAGYVILWLAKLLFNVEIPANIQKFYMVVVGLYALYMIVALLFGLGLPFRFISSFSFGNYIIAT